MERCERLIQTLGAALIFLISFTEVSAIICKDTGESCKQCCEGRCCANDEESMSYTYRISFWNLWYFWFVVLFILMSCFGGCGYYKHKQRLLLTPRDNFVHRGRQNARNTPGFGVTVPHVSSHNPTALNEMQPVSGQMPISVLPPPYSEVAHQPKNHFEAKPPPYPDDVNPPGYSEATTKENQYKS
ncbi:uncharacterized protein LOC111115672 [Crassostrea virginica]